MTPASRERARVDAVLLGLSGLSWVALLVGGARLMPGPATLMGASHSAHPSATTYPSLAIGFVLMLVAMMAPTLMRPVHHVRAQSFTHRRFRSVALFLCGYGAVWLAAGAVLVGIVLATEVAAVPRPVAAAVMAMLVVVWQCSPTRQLCLNRAHYHPALAAFGSAADRDVLRFGTGHGLSCVGTCWALMLFPMLLHQGHLPAMAVATLVVFSERLARPAPVRWSARVPVKLVRILVAQVRIRLADPGSAGARARSRPPGSASAPHSR